MLNANVLKGGAVALLLLAALAAFDAFGSFSAKYPAKSITGMEVAPQLPSEPLQPSQPASRLTVELQPGWNLIAISSLSSLVRASPECDAGVRGGSVYAYYPQRNDYGTYSITDDLKHLGSGSSESEKLRTDYISYYQDTLLKAGAAWVFNKGEGACKITANLQPRGGFLLSKGWNFIAVQHGWIGKGIEEYAGTCKGKIVEAHTFPSQSRSWRLIRKEETSNTPTTNFPLNEDEAGKGVVIYASEDCRWGGAAPEAADGAKEEAKGGIDKDVNIALQLLQVYLIKGGKVGSDSVLLTDGSEIHSGDTIYINPQIIKTGDKQPGLQGVDGAVPVINIVYAYKEREYGERLISPIVTDVMLGKIISSLKQEGHLDAIPRAESNKRFIKVPEDFTGKLIVIAAAVDTQNIYPESDERDNRVSMTLKVSPGKPNLKVEKADATPSKVSLPAALAGATITILNTGPLAVSGNSLMTSKVSILKNGKEVCSARRSDFVSLDVGASIELMLTGMSSDGAPCQLTDKTAAYEVVGEADAQNTIPEDSETDNSAKKPLEVIK